jgi:alpha-tubulin suppressor-like RCC1 family protein
MDRRRIRKAVCGARHTVLISSRGEMYSSGWGIYGQLGHGDNLDALYSKKIESDWAAATVASKEHINLALTSKMTKNVFTQNFQPNMMCINGAENLSKQTKRIMKQTIGLD